MIRLGNLCGRDDHIQAFLHPLQINSHNIFHKGRLIPHQHVDFIYQILPAFFWRIQYLIFTSSSFISQYQPLFELVEINHQATEFPNFEVKVYFVPPL
jgi:hypothetical protein